MYTLLIADDEQLERDAIELLVQRGGFPLRCLKARNGREAVEIAHRERPDLAFLDIRMPGMDGIEAARRIREALPACGIVFLTAWSSFDFAQEAIRLGAQDYLVKPAAGQDVCAVLKKLLSSREEEEKTERERRRKDELEEVVSLFSREFFASIKFGQVPEDAMRSYFRLQGITLEKGFALVCGGLSEEEALDLCAREGGFSSSHISYFPSVDRITLLVFCADSRRAAEAVRRAALLLEKGQCFGEGRAFVSLGGIADSIRTASLAYSEAVHRALPFCRFGKPPPAEKRGAQSRPRQIQKMLRLTLEGSQKEARRRAHEVVDLVASSRVSREAMEQELYDASLVFFYGVQENIPCFFREAPQKTSLAMQETYLMDYIDAACAAVTLDRKDKYRRIFDFIRDYVGSSYAEELTLDSAAGLAGIRPEYFGRLFSKYAGASFAEYLAGVRMENAARLLAEGASVKEAALRTGFTDGNYFSRVFRRRYGCSPREYGGHGDA
jgi:two-component system response regulator YesN